MKSLQSYLLLALLLVLLAGCSGGNKADGGIPFSIEGKVLGTVGVGDTLQAKLFLVAGTSKELIASSPMDMDKGVGTFELEGQVASPGVYILEFPPISSIAIIVGLDPQFKMQVQCFSPQDNPVFEGSPENTAFWAYNLAAYNIQNEFRAANAIADTAELRKKQIQLWQKQKDLHAQLGKDKKVLPVLFAANEVAPMGANESGKTYPSELEYYLDVLLAKDSLMNPIFGYTPQYFGKMGDYTGLLVRKGENPAQLVQSIDSLAKLVPAGSRNEEILLYAAAMKCEQLVDYFAPLAQKYLTKFPETPRSAAVRAKLDSYAGLMVGETAPEFALATPEGPEYKLSSLRGKYVLLDFWASWCKPCRAENPNVVRMYNQYKDKGFDILSVSLDKKREDWLKAIKDDKMVWHHVSDLQYWESPIARLYQIDAIPATLLLDKEGKIIARNLRGSALEKKLAELLP